MIYVKTYRIYKICFQEIFYTLLINFIYKSYNGISRSTFKFLINVYLHIRYHFFNDSYTTATIIHIKITKTDVIKCMYNYLTCLNVFNIIIFSTSL